MFEHSNYVYTVYKEGSFSKASRKLYITQPALSIAIKKIEEELGTPIFNRKTNPLTLTEGGKTYISAIEEMNAIEERMQDYFENLNEMKTGKVAIGGASIAMSSVIPEIVLRFKEKYPNIEIVLQEDSISQVERLLEEEVVDLVIDSDNFNHEKFETIELFKNDILLAVPKKFIKDDTLYKKGYAKEAISRDYHLKDMLGKVSLLEFKDVPMLMMQKSTSLYRTGKQIFNYYGINPKKSLVFNQQYTAFTYVTKGIGMMLISDTLAKYAKDNNEVLYYRLDCPSESRSIVLSYKKNRYLTRATNTFIKEAVDTCKELSSKL